MSTHFGEYDLDLYGATVKAELSVKYTWHTEIPATRETPAEGGPEIESVTALLGYERYELPDCPPDLLGDIRDAIWKEHQRPRYED